jgi:Spy/CpxP family protein refolding chaperone
MKRILLTLAAVATLALATLGTVRAQGEGDQPNESDDEMVGAMLADWGGHGGMEELAPRGTMGMHGHGGGAMGMRGGMGRGMYGPEAALLRGGGRLAEELNLSGTQRDRLRAIGETLARKRIQLRADLELAHLDLRSAMRTDSPAMTDLESKIDAVTRIQGDMMKAGVSARLDARKVLTPEQREKLSDMRPTRGKGAPGRPGARGEKK